MSFLKPTVIIFILGNIFLFSQVSGSANLGNNSSASEKSDNYVSDSFFSMKEVKSAGYRAITNYKEGFIAVGSDGRIDWISVTGKITKSRSYPGERFNCVISDNKRIIVAGDKGILRISNEGDVFRKLENGSERNINSITIFNGTIIAGADNGIIVSGNEDVPFKEIKLNLKGNIVSVSMGISDCYGVTDEGEIIHTRDGINWEIIDFNKVYAGYYKTCYFTKVLVTENRIAVSGTQTDGSPVVMFSTQGNVWTERPLYYTDDQGMKMFLDASPNDLVYDETSDQYFLACDKGGLMQLPSCSQCNKLALIQKEDIEGISLLENVMMLVGKNFVIKALNIR